MIFTVDIIDFQYWIYGTASFFNDSARQVTPEKFPVKFQ